MNASSRVYEYWYDADQTVLMQVFEDGWLTPEYVASVRRVAALIQDRHPTPIYQILDMTNSHEIPTDISKQALFTSSMLQPNIALVVVVGLPRTGQQLLMLMRPFMPQLHRRMRLIDSLPDAERFIQVAQRITGGNEASPAC